MLDWSIEQIKLDLKYTWKLSRNATNFKLNNIISVGNGKCIGKGEVAPNIRYNETPELMLLEFERFVKEAPEHIQGIEDLTILLNGLKLPNALRFGIESAYVHFTCNQQGQTVEAYLGLKQLPSVFTSFSLPIMPSDQIAGFVKQYDLARFQRLKLKVDAENAHDLLSSLSQVTRQPLIIDANESWKDPDSLIVFLKELTAYNIDVIEQPMPASMAQEYVYVKKHSPFLLMADESVCDYANFEELKNQFHGINMKLMKAGGYLNGLQLLKQAQSFQMNTMVGCMIETSLGISSALHLCDGVQFIDLDGFMILTNEPFQLVAEKDGQLSFA